jgi:hypothetical protein
MVLALAILGASISITATAAAPTSKITKARKGKLTASAKGSNETSFEARQGPSVDSSFQKFISGTKNPARVPSAHVPTPAPNAVSGVTPFGFNGLRHRDQRFANGGNQFSLEPPDQGLAVGTTQCGGHICVLEAVNDVLAVYDGVTQSQLAFSDINSFMVCRLRRLAMRRASSLLLDRCHRSRSTDTATSRWFVTALEIDQDVNTGDY